MTVEERIAQFLLARPGQPYCDDCLADELAINRHQARNATSALGASGRFRRNYGASSKRHHDRDNKVIMA